MVSPRSLSVYRVPSSACSETVQQMVREPHGSCSAPSSSSFSLVLPSYLVLTFTFFFCIIHEASSLQFLSLTSSASFSCPVFRVLFSSFAFYTSSSTSYLSSLSLVLLLLLVPRVLLLRDLLWFFVTSLSSFAFALLRFFSSPSLVLLLSFRSIYCPFLLVRTWPRRSPSLCLLRVSLYVTVSSCASSSTFLYSFICIYFLHSLYSFVRIA